MPQLDSDGVDEMLTKDHLFLVRHKFDENWCDLTGGHQNQLISGRGAKSNAFCGVFNMGYDSGVNGAHSVYHCKVQGCPTCFRYWAKALGAKVASFIMAVTAKNGTVPFHCTISPDPARGFRGWKSLAKVFKTIVSRFGTESKVPVFRGKYDDKGEPIFETNTLPDVGWCFVKHPRRLRCISCDASREHWDGSRCPVCGEPGKPVWRWSPHAHMVTDFMFTYKRRHAMARYMARVGVVFKNINASEGTGIGDLAHCANITTYELSHALWLPGARNKKALVWCGAWQQNRLKRWYESIKEDVIDPVNGEPFRPVDVRVVRNTASGTIWQPTLPLVFLSEPNLQNTEYIVHFDMENKPPLVTNNWRSDAEDDMHFTWIQERKRSIKRHSCISEHIARVFDEPDTLDKMIAAASIPPVELIYVE